MSTRREMKKVLICLVCAYLVSFILLIPLFFFGYKEYPLGIIIGGGVGTLNTFLLYRYAESITHIQGSRKVTFLCYIGRYFIYGVGLLLCLLLEYFDIRLFSWVTCAICYMFPLITIIIVQNSTKIIKDTSK